VAGILVVSEVFPPAIGGSGMLLENVYRRIRGRKVRVLAGSPPAGQVYEGPLDVSYVDMAAPDWGVLRPASFRRHLRLCRAIRAAAAGGQEHGFAIHCARALPEGLAALAAARGPVVCWLHGEELGYASTSRELSWLARRVYRRCAAVIANSANSRDLLIRDWGIDPSKISVVHPGVDPSRFRPDTDGSTIRARLGIGSELVLLSVGRLQRRKGHDMALQAIAQVRDTCAVRYVITGDGPHRTELERLAQDLGLEGVVDFVGSVPEADLPAWYAAADVFLLPNRLDGVDFEGFGIVFLEAAASGLPVIAGRSGGAVEAVVDGVTGMLVEPTNVEAIAGAIRELSARPTLRDAMGSAGRRRVEDSFSWQTVAARAESVMSA
jgi:phosphatidylinositol alpha-1,6-mannosyltransferase